MTSTPPPNPPDASALAAEVRQLARLAHRLLSDPAIDSRQIDELSRRIAKLRRQVAARQAAPLAKWLDHLARRLPALQA